MPSFIVACVAAAVLAIVCALFLGALQEPVSVAFATQSVRL
jgi:hypothetical protein